MRRSVPFIVWSVLIALSFLLFMLGALFSQKPPENWMMPIALLIGFILGAVYSNIINDNEKF